MIEVRRWMEQLVGQLAAERISTDQIDQLKGILEAVDRLAAAGKIDVDSLNRHDIRFHNLLYQATGNLGWRERAMPAKGFLDS